MSYILGEKTTFSAVIVNIKYDYLEYQTKIHFQKWQISHRCLISPLIQRQTHPSHNQRPQTPSKYAEHRVQISMVEMRKFIFKHITKTSAIPALIPYPSLRKTNKCVPKSIRKNKEVVIE